MLEYIRSALSALLANKVRAALTMLGVVIGVLAVVVTVHGGPTAAADPSFSLAVQFWTTRGLAVADVDYGGSTGYGRSYRRLLDDGWGVVDVEDACAAARWLAASVSRSRCDLGAPLTILPGVPAGATGIGVPSGFLPTAAIVRRR